MQQYHNPFSTNPFTRNVSYPQVQFASTDQQRKELKVPVSTSSWQEAQSAYKDMHVPQQQTPFDRIGAFNVRVFPDGTRVIQPQSSVGEWGDPWGREEAACEQALNKRSAEYARISRIENKKLMDELEKDSFRKQLLSDVESGKLFPKSRLVEVPDDSSEGGITFTKQN